MTTREVIAWIVVGMLLLFGGFMTYKTLSVGSDNKLLTTELSACRDAPVKVHDSIHDSIVYCDRWHTPKPVPYPVYIDTVKPKWCEQSYDDSLVVFEGKLRGVVKYKAFDKDCQLKINPYESHFPIVYREITKTLLKDTCIKIKQPLFRWGPYAGMTLNSFSKFPGIKVGAQVVAKDQVTIAGGILLMNGIYGDITIGWLFKK